MSNNDTIRKSPNSLVTPFLDQEILIAESQKEPDSRITRLAEESPFERVSLKSGVAAPQFSSPEADSGEWISESERPWFSSEETEAEDVVDHRTDENEAFADAVAYDESEAEGIVVEEREYADDDEYRAFMAELNVDVEEERALWMPAEPEIEEIVVDAEIIGTNDDRVHVADTNVVPWRWVCALDLPLDDPGASRGSGVLVGPRHLLTAAHVLPRGDPDKLAKVRISPARNSDNADHPFGAYSVRRVRYPWRNVDLALVTLDRELPAALGFWGHDPAQAQLRVFARDDLIGKRVTVSGYPGDRCNTDRIDGTARQKQNGMRQCMKDSPRRWASTLWRAHGTARVPPAQPFVFYDADTYKGQSGGPVALSDGGVHVCVGIHVNGTKQSNWGVRLTPAILGDVRDAINADAGAAIASVVGDALVVQVAAPRREAFSGEDEALPWSAPMPEREAFEPPELEGFEEVVVPAASLRVIQQAPLTDHEEHESSDSGGALHPEDEAELESPQDLEDLYGRVHEYDQDQGEELAELKETKDLESDEELDWLTEDSGEEESERDEEDSVEVELDTPKGGAKKSSLHRTPTTDIFMHVYFPKLDTSYTRQQYFDWIVSQSPGEMGPNRFQLAGVTINLVGSSSTAVSDFKGSLKAAGSIVVYFGHTVLGPKTTLGLALKDPPEKKPGITCAELTKLLNVAKAKIVVLAGCATNQCVTKIKGETVVIVTQSGKDRLTNTLQWAPAIKALLDELLAGGTVGDALSAANKSFAKASSTDSFKMINGDPTLKMI